MGKVTNLKEEIEDPTPILAAARSILYLNSGSYTREGDGCGLAYGSKAFMQAYLCFGNSTNRQEYLDQWLLMHPILIIYKAYGL